MDESVFKTNLNDFDRTNDKMVASSRQRVSFNRTSPLTLTGSWQTLPLTSATTSSGSIYNSNQFPTNRYDTTNNLILANPDTDFEQAYNLSLDIAVKGNSSTNAIKLQIRFAVPAPTPIYFPLPESLGYIELPDEITGSVTTGIHFDYPVYTNSLIRQYGARIQVNYRSYRLNANLITGVANAVTQTLSGVQRPQITDAALNMYSI